MSDRNTALAADVIERTGRLLELLGHNEEPFGIHYADTPPEGAFGPKPGVVFSREAEEAGTLDWQRAFADFSCVMGNIWLARKKKKAAFISLEQCGCMGGGFYSGMYSPYLETNIAYVSTGRPGTPMEGEHYLNSFDSMRAFMDDCDPRPAPAGYGVAKPLSQFTGAEEPEIVVFFARGEVLTGLSCLCCYAAGSHLAVVSPFGAGCTNIYTWPLTYLRRGEEKAVLGGLDPSARKFMKTDELTFAAPLVLYRKMLDCMESSALTRHTWQGVRKKALKSARIWGEDGEK